MKTYKLRTYGRALPTSLISLGLSLAGVTGMMAAPAQPDASPANAPVNDEQSWEQQFSDRMQHIQREMDDLFRDSMNGMDWSGKEITGWPKFDASATVQDRGNAYVASFDLPKRDLSNVKVTVKDGVLTVNASAEVKQDGKAGGVNAPDSQSVMLDQYEQLVTLPGPVDSTKMKVDKQGEGIVVTLPKKDIKGSAGK
jgi:HSP20 family molecular chaperone IbpA